MTMTLTPIPTKERPGLGEGEVVRNETRPGEKKSGA